MEEEFVPYELAVKLKKLGFDKPCRSRYLYDEFQHSSITVDFNSKNIPTWTSAPTLSQAFRWFREKHELYSWVQLHNGYIDDSFYKKLPITWTIMEHESGKQYYERDIDHNYLYHTHEEAELACLTKLIEIVESNKVA